MQTLVADVNRFTFNLFDALSKDNPDNLICSPKNIVDCFSMVYLGARERTIASIQKAIGFTQDASKVLSLIGEFNDLLAKDKATIKTANGVWADQRYPFAKSYMDVLTLSKAKMTVMDFDKSKEVSDDINTWVGEQTLSEAGEPLIKNLVEPGMFNKNTVMTLVSAIYYLAKFKTQFDVSKTKVMPFTMANGKTTDCKMMNRRGKYRVASTDVLDMCDIPYDGDTVLSVILPKENTLDVGFTDLNFQLLQTMGKEIEVDLSLPKFKVESSFDLKSALCALGMSTAFSDNADFGGMIEEGTKDSAIGLKIGKVIHKAFVDTTEAGTEAAAATAVMMVKRCMVREPERFVFNANHPFLYVIWHKPTGGILFVGRNTFPAGY